MVFMGEISMLSMLAWDRKIVRIFLTMESMGIYKNESMEGIGTMVFSSISVLIISRKHGKHGIYANELISLWFPGSSWLSWPLLRP